MLGAEPIGLWTCQERPAAIRSFNQNIGPEIRLLGFGPVRSVIRSLEREVDHGSLLFPRSSSGLPAMRPFSRPML
jgi:hypothetical protein